MATVTRRTRPPIHVLILLCLALVGRTSLASAQNDQEAASAPLSASLFEPSPLIAVLGPTSFPKPTDKIPNNPKFPETQAVPIIKPIIGTHRPDRDVVMAYAEGYTVEYYLLFIESLRDTGFDGDIVLAIAEERVRAPDVFDYLTSQQHVVVYESALYCYDSDGTTPLPRKVNRGDLDVFQMCQFNHVYGWTDPSDQRVLETAEDPRHGRVVATLRYEWYWIWALKYNSNSWVMLLDARDSFFQQNPFLGLPRSTDKDLPSGVLYFFGENHEATRLGKSRKNANWLRNGYGEETLRALSDKPTICSGSTMGQQVALETYLRAMVNEKDETEIKMTGADQGFHNYLYYSNKLANARTIDRIVVWEQGKGIINNLGALRTKPLSEWEDMFNNKTLQVFNWDGELSPVAHQWDRDHVLYHGTRARFNGLKTKWRQTPRKRE